MPLEVEVEVMVGVQAQAQVQVQTEFEVEVQDNRNLDNCCKLLAGTVAGIPALALERCRALQGEQKLVQRSAMLQYGQTTDYRCI